MIIMTQDSDAVYDTEKFAGIYTQNSSIYLLSYTGEVAYPLGTYKNDDRCKDIVRDIFAFEGCQSKYDMPFV